MSKSTKRGRKRTRKVPSAQARRRSLMKIVVAVLAVCLMATSAAVLRREPLRRSLGLAPVEPVPAQGGNLPLSKEYIYAGGRLIATEEPTPTPAGPAPTNLVATATTTTSVSLSWTAPASGSVSNYVVERSQSVNGPYTPLTPNPTATNFTDNTASANTAYLYRVKAAFTSGGNSDYSNKDIATTITFDDDPLIGTAGNPNPATATPIRALHINQLRTAVNAVRALAGLSTATWTYADSTGSVTTSMLIHHEDVTDLRLRLGEALTTLGLPLPNYRYAVAQGVTVHKEDVQELRDAVK